MTGFRKKEGWNPSLACAKIREFVDSISTSELESILNEIHKAKESLNLVQHQVTQIRLWKEVFNSAKSLATSTG